jgi:uncharacterized protein YgbK (DUF1537 family)
MEAEAQQSKRILRSELLASLPPVWAGDPIPNIQTEIYRHERKVVVLDDDPTGTQTVYDVPVLTEWSVESLGAELRSELRCFYILTNSRSLSPAEASRINREIGQNLLQANKGLGRDFVVISRSDSTLRGHFPGEVEALGQAVYIDGGATHLLPPILLVPFFEAGGRYTVNDIHYVSEGEWLYPAAETEFARDPVFGYKSSNLREWVVEKSNGRVRPREVFSVSIDDLRSKGPDEVAWKLLSLEEGSICVANAARARDLDVLALATLRAEKQGGRMLYRTAASFVAARLGLAPRPLWRPVADGPHPAWVHRGSMNAPASGGLIIAGSHVPRTTEQLNQLLATGKVESISLPVARLLGVECAQEVSKASAAVNAQLRVGGDVVVFTSRELAVGEDVEKSLRIGQRISEALVQLLQAVDVKPRYLIAKGGITAGDLVRKGLGVKRAMVLGQIQPGVPVWELGLETRFPGMPCVIFPGNVGGPSTLADIVKLFRPTAG